MKRLELPEWIRRLDPIGDAPETCRLRAAFESPRDYAVPGPGRLLVRTAEPTGRTQKRCDGTAPLLDAIVEHGFPRRRVPRGSPAPPSA